MSEAPSSQPRSGAIASNPFKQLWLWYPMRVVSRKMIVMDFHLLIIRIEEIHRGSLQVINITLFISLQILDIADPNRIIPRIGIGGRIKPYIKMLQRREK